MNDEEYILEIIRTVCAQHHATDLLDDFRCYVDQINSCQKRCTLKFCNELPDYFDILINNEFQDSPDFHEWLAKHVRNYIFDARALPYESDSQDSSRLEDAVDASRYAYVNGFIRAGRANGKTKVLYNRGDNLGKYAKYFYNEKGKSTMAMTEGIKIATDRYMSESEAHYDAELKRIETELNQKITDAQYEAQKKRCELEAWFRKCKITEQESEKAQKRRAYYDGLIASGFTEDQAMKILLEEL